MLQGWQNGPSIRPCVQRLAPISAGESQDVTKKSCSICLRGEKMPSGLPHDPWVPGAPEPRMYPCSGYFLVINEMMQQQFTNFVVWISTENKDG